MILKMSLGKEILCPRWVDVCMRRGRGGLDTGTRKNVSRGWIVQKVYIMIEDD